MITIEVVAPPSHEDAIQRIAKQSDAVDSWVSSQSDKQIAIKILIEKSKSQKVIDQLQMIKSLKKAPPLLPVKRCYLS